MHLNKKLIFQTELQNQQQLSDVVQFVQSHLKPKTCLLLVGDLAAGKTTFVSAFCAQLGIQDVASPTFAIHHQYASKTISVDHFDLYRLENSDDIETSGLWDALNKPANIVFIEWPQRIHYEDIPLDCYKLEICFYKKTNDDQSTAREILIYAV